MEQYNFAEMTEKQSEIFKGLKSIGQEIAFFYLDGIEIVNSDLKTKSYLIGHLLREIDGGLRNIFESKIKKEEFQKSVTSEKLTELFEEFKEDYKNYEYLKDITVEEFRKEKGHISSVMASFGFSIDSQLSKQYIKITRWLHKYAHRSGAFNLPRDPKDIINIWNEYEEVLSKLIGNYYSLADRIDSIIKMVEPTKEVLQTLPNLLNHESRLVYFFSELKSIKWLPHLSDRGYFKASLNPRPTHKKGKLDYYSIQRWEVIPYLEEVSNYNQIKPSKEVSDTLSKIIRDTILFENEDGTRTKNGITDYFLFKLICKIPEEYIDEFHFKFIRELLESKSDILIGDSFGDLLEKFILTKNITLLKRCIFILLSHRYDEERPFDKIDSLLKDFDLTKIISNYKTKLISVAGIELLKIGLNKMDEYIVLDDYIFNQLTIPAVEDHEQTSFPDKFECQIVYLIRDCLEVLPFGFTLVKLKELLNKEHAIFKRIAVHTIKIRYSEFKDLYWSWCSNPLNFELVKHEVYELHKQHSVSFTKKEIHLVLKWIEEKEYYIPEGIKTDLSKISRSIAYSKKEWLTSIAATKFMDVKGLIAILNEVNDIEIEHPGFNSWHSGFSGNKSPLTIDEFTHLSLDNVIEYFNRFNQLPHDFLGPSEDGFIDALTISIRTNPNKYCIDSAPILNAPIQIQYAWIRGINEGWNERKLKFQTKELFNLAYEIIKQPDFWIAHNANGNYKRWFVSALISLIEDGLKDDTHAFSSDNLPVIKALLFMIHDQNTLDISDYSDLTMLALNNSKGKIYSTFFQYSLRVARLENRDSDRWDKEIKGLISERLARGEDNPLLYYVIGQFLLNIHFLDEQWMFDNLSRIFPTTNEINWAAAIRGYFYVNRNPNKIHFKHLIEKGHLQKAILSEAIVGEAKKGLVQQICTAYLYDYEGVDLDSSILKSLFETKNVDIYSTIIYFFWSPKFPFEKKVRHKIKPLWIQIFHKSIELKDVEEDKYMLSGSCKWLNSIPEMDDEITNLLLQSMPFVSQANRYFIIESLSKHINSNPARVGSVLLELFKHEVTYDVSRGKLRDMVEILYKRNLNKLGSDICLLHAEKGFHFLRDVYIEYNN